MQRFIKQYILPSMQSSGWAIEDFGKPGIEKANPVSHMWIPKVKAVYRANNDSFSSLLFRLEFDESASSQYGAPQQSWLSYTISQDRPEIYADLQWFKKSPCRLPEAFWFGFVPLASGELDWKMEKLGKWISPLSVVENGNRHLHAVGKGVTGTVGRNMLRSHLWIPHWWHRGSLPCWISIIAQPDLSKGMHFCLLDNLWGTNFPMWFEEDCRFRFVIEVSVHPTNTDNLQP